MPEGTTIWDAAKEAGIEIPVLCHDERYDPVGVCRICAVDVGGRVYAAACVRPGEDGMEVKTGTPEVEQHRATLTQLLLSDQPPAEEDPKETTTADNELLELARRYGLEREDGIPIGSGRGVDDSNPVISVNHDACILCDRCVRACDDIQGNDVIGRSGKGYTARIAFDLQRVLRTNYLIDSYQKTYFVLDDIEQLFDSVLAADFESLFAQPTQPEYAPDARRVSPPGPTTHQRRTRSTTASGPDPG